MKRGSSTAPHDRALDRADVGHHALRRRDRQHVRDHAASDLHGRGDEGEVGVRDRLLDASRAASTIAPRAIAASRAAADGS